MRRYVAPDPLAVAIGKAPIPAFIAMIVLRVRAIINSNIVGIQHDHDARWTGHYCLGRPTDVPGVGVIGQASTGSRI